MTRKEKRQLRAAFCEIDTSNKGYVTKNEIIKYLMKTNDLSGGAAEKRATEMMKIMDRKHCGHISVKSFVYSKKLSLIQDQFSNDESLNSKISAVFDPTESGYVDTATVETALKETTSREDSELIVNRLDPDNTGKIPIDSFIQITSTHTTPRSSIVGSVSPPITDDTIFTPPDTVGSINTSTNGNGGAGGGPYGISNGYGIPWSSLPIHENHDQDLPSPLYHGQNSGSKKSPSAHKLTNNGARRSSSAKDYTEYTNFKSNN